MNLKTIEGITICNTTPHKINFLSEKTGKEYEVEPSGFILNAKPEEVVAKKNHEITFVKTEFCPTEDGIKTIDSIPEDVIIVGSMIAAKAYSRCVAMTPSKGFERVPPAEKRMNLYKFTLA